MGVNLEVFHGIWSSRLYKCRPAGAWVFGVDACYTNAAPLGLKTIPSPTCPCIRLHAVSTKTFFENEKHISFFLN